MSNADIVADTIFQAIVEKDSLFESQREETIKRIKIQYEEYLYVNLLALLDENTREAFDQLIDSEPMNKQAHDEFLAQNIPNIKDEILNLTRNYISNYQSFSKNIS